MLISGLCGRISEGNKHADFEKLSVRANRKIVYMAGPDLLSTYLGKSAFEILIHVGIDPFNVLEKVKLGGYYRLFVLPQKKRDCNLSTWDNLYKLTKKLYGDAVFKKLLPMKKQIEDTPFHEIPGYEDLIHLNNSLTEEEKHGHPRFYMADKILAIPGPLTLKEARGFFYHACGANHLGLTAGVNISGFDDYICENYEIKKVKGLAFIDLQVTEQEIHAYLKDHTRNKK